jgi:hypothetical protein
MNFSEITRNVLRLVETRSGIPVHVEVDSSLPGSTLAKVVMARGALALHRVTYRPDSSSPPDYLDLSAGGIHSAVFRDAPGQAF